MRSPSITYRYPSEESIPSGALQFAFPDKQFVEFAEGASLNYTATITSQNGDHNYLFCRRYYDLSHEKMVCICLLLQEPCHEFMRGVMYLAELAYKDSFEALIDFCVSLRECPSPGGSIIAPVLGVDYKVERPNYGVPSYGFGQISFSKLLSNLHVSNLMSLSCALVNERRIILVSDDLEKLSECAYSMLSLLYPYTWQLIFIPILPQEMLTYCSAPMPFIIGIHSSHYEEVMKLPLEEIVFVYLDMNKVFIDVEDSLILPNCTDELQYAIRLQTLQNSKDNTHISNSAINEKVSDFFATVTGSYLWFFYKNKEGLHEFDTEEYINSQNEDIAKFLSCFTQTQMFEQFISHRKELLNQSKNFDTTFDRKCNELFKSGRPTRTDSISTMDSLISLGRKVIGKKDFITPDTNHSPRRDLIDISYTLNHGGNYQTTKKTSPYTEISRYQSGNTAANVDLSHSVSATPIYSRTNPFITSPKQEKTRQTNPFLKKTTSSKNKWGPPLIQSSNW
eukprot:TRINITY_DN2397_c0_g1_i1.p1 TRINITY_DN2397_c0_g1~~TRINITY_DN2397_c0_g1_i1.p1  ORF type:complete len:526 (-),score=71.81 TRINITY_DN2397_c0_g1_i1:48-1571(-)